VRIRNLKTEEGREINGKTGEVSDFDAGKGRWIVTVDDRSLNLKPENLELCFMATPLPVILFMAPPAPWTRKKQEGGPVAGEFENEDVEIPCGPDCLLLTNCCSCFMTDSDWHVSSSNLCPISNKTSAQ
jgi:hypothetical protein